MLDMQVATIDTWFLLTQSSEAVWVKLERILKGDYKLQVQKTGFHGDVTLESRPADAPTGITHLKKLLGLKEADKLKVNPILIIDLQNRFSTLCFKREKHCNG